MNDIESLISDISNARWRVICLKLDATFEEITESALLLPVVAANEKWREENNSDKDNFAEIERWSPIATAKYLSGDESEEE